ncbi:SMI1/KNR4 family protein [Acetivibrio clariflavus]|uniref:Knr4/Smi1-like domain-containing protein n=1 Tax=Acetivibrio clariflavus (strain DSM 19732 / NBRC 101661 / EBR45) TaxID=720554 RepID=G8M257_ACECE|nr:SMI1/KNR4 family protein [Acetivibrio clariflavus]AEV68175.1 hypothetical protein Clocl_1533 [Acetivibrio clariflavus DSM 19732]
MDINNLLPQIYIDLNKKGYTDLNNFISFDNINQNYLWFIDLIWLSHDEILKKESFHNINMIPFAYTNGGDYWCFDLNHKDCMPIVCCYHDGKAKYYAKTLEAALFRQILLFAVNEFTDSDITDKDSIEIGKQIICNWISKLRDYFPKEWISELNNIVNNKDYEEVSPGHFSIISKNKYDELIKKYIDFELLDKKFVWINGADDVTKFYY